jgi:hypothetical protein
MLIRYYIERDSNKVPRNNYGTNASTHIKSSRSSETKENICNGHNASSIATSVELDNFVDGSLHQTAIRDNAFTPAHLVFVQPFDCSSIRMGICSNA